MSFFDPERFKIDLSQSYEIEEIKATKKTAPAVLKKLIGLMKKHGETKHVFGMYTGNQRFYLLTLKNEDIIEEIVAEDKSKAWKKLDVTILHYTVFDRVLGIAQQTAEKVTYTQNAEEAVKMVDEKGYQVAFLLNPTKVTEITAIASKTEKMPHKSTFFYPKLLSGLVVNKIVHGDKIKL